MEGLIDPPGPFDPSTEWRKFLAALERSPLGKSEQGKEELANGRKYLALALERERNQRSKASNTSSPVPSGEQMKMSPTELTMPPVPESKPDQNNPKPTYSFRPWPSALAQEAWGKAIERAGKESGNLSQVREGRALQQNARERLPK